MNLYSRLKWWFYSLECFFLTLLQVKWWQAESELCFWSTDAIGLSGMFLIYGVSAVAAGIFFYFMLPETKGKTLEEIDKELRLNRYNLYVSLIIFTSCQIHAKELMCLFLAMSHRFYHSEKCCSIFNWRNTSRQYQRVHCQVSTSEWLIWHWHTDR